ncbi:hypothetical protein ABMA27_007612 [Loxostege sticticalis]|uniref:Cysteine proteinase inhibitor n=1 Tax=Loxostege sticticalis TaxID=481309 RepID=A0ABR3HG21_LOXSC
MRQFILVILFVQCLTNFCAGELSTEKKDLYLNGFIDYLNSLPNQAFAYEDGVILNAEESTDNGYKIEARIKANDLHNLDTFKYVKCTGTVRDAGETEVSVDAYQCQDEEETQTQADIEEEVTNETPLEHEPVKLDNEVQTDTAVTSGEQFVAVPRGQGSAPCIGCASPVNPEAAGVPELASLGVTQLNEYEPNVAHTLNKVVSVERQVQVVNGVRYILTLLVDYNSCSSAVTETCMATKPCKVSVLEKPWVKLPDGSKYRRIVSNNCTNDWIFREHESNSSKNDGDNAGAIDEMVSFVHNKDVQSQPGLDKALTDDDIKKIQEQIISHDHFKQSLANSNDQKVPTEDTNTNDFTKQQNFYIESQKTLGKNAEDVVKNSDTVPSNDINLPGSQVVPNGLSTDQKKTIDDLMNFFDFSNFNPKPEDKQNTLRIKRSFDNDLKVFRLAEKFSEIKKTIKNTKYLYTLAEAMVTYLNEIDMEIKNRVVKNVLSAEEESDVTQHFYYLQVLVEIPCQKVQCDNDKLNKICNGVIDTTHETNPQVLNVFCYDMKKNATNWGRMYHVPDSDPILRNMAISALKKIESESPDENALKLIKIINGNTQKVHGILTKITVLIGYTKCKKTENFAKRSNCTVDRDMGTKICDIDVLQRRWLKENKITYVCTERPASESFVDSKKTDTNVNDRSVQEIVQEALQFLEVQSNRNNKQKVVEIKSVSTQLVAGLLTNIDFTVGYTICTNEFDVDVENCKLIKSEPLRHCQAQVWHRPWLEDGRQMNVSCKNTKTSVPEQDNLPDQELIESLRNKRETHFANYSERQREKRQIAGGETEENPNDPKYLALAEESLQQYMQTTGNTQPHSVTKVDSVRTQVVAGFLTKIVFTVIAGNSDVIQCYSEVWERPWLSKKEITVNCGMKNQIRQKREDIIMGGEMEQNPNDPEYLALAEEALKKYIQTSGSTQPHSVTKVDKVTTQVVTGVLTRIDFTVNVGNSDVIQCHSEVLEPPGADEKEITVNCGMKNQIRQKREVTFTGGDLEHNPNDPKYLALAEESLQQYIQTTGNTQPHSVTKVDRVRTQVVSGTLTKIDFTVNVGISDVIHCHSRVWEQAWLSKKEITVNCGSDENKLREKRQAPGDRLSGAPIAQDHTLPEYLSLAKTCLKVYLQNKNSTQHHKVIEVKEVTTQVVAGVMTRLTFLVSPTNCQIDNKGVPSAESCEILDKTDVRRCFAKVWDKPWKSERTISVDCKLSRSKREIFADRLKTHNRRLITNMGSEVEQDASKAEYRTLAEESLRKYQRLQKSEVIHTVLEVKRVFTKLVSGTIYKIDFTAQPSKCSKNTLNVSSCSQLHENQTIYCQSEVWDRPWLKRKDIEVDCYTDNHNINEEELNHEEDKEDTPLKGGLLGGSAPQDKTAERFKIIANAATRKFESSGKTKYVHKVVKINEATEQIIDGNLVIVKFTVSPTTCLIKDAITDVDKCPIDNNEIKLQCTARVLEQIALEFDEDKMRVSCKRKHQTHIDRQKRSIDVREKRQNRFYDEEIDEETKYYYADKAVQYLNDHSSTHNVQKLITIHSVQNSMHMKVPMVRMYLETAYTYCLRDEHQQDLHLCDELDGMAHRLCLAKLFPAAEDELIVHKVYVVCDDDTDFTKTTGLAISELVAVSVLKLENSPNIKYKLVHQGEPNVAPSLDMKLPVKLHFIVASTNCTKDQDPKRDNVACYIDTTRTAKSCISYIWIVPNEKRISRINVKCNEPSRRKRSLSNDTVSTKSDEARIKQLVQASLEKLEMSSLHRYKQRVLLINSYSTKITTGKVTTIDFDVGYTNCLKYEWIDNITKCEFLEHLPRRHCVSQVWERLWIKNGRNIEVNCEDDETPLESRIEFESAETAMQLAKHSLKHIEAKYPHPKKQQVVRIFSLEKQAVAGMHYRMKLEVGFTNCSALSFESGCTLINDGSMNRFCRVNVWLRTWTNHPPIYRVSCDYQDGTSTELYHHIQAEQLFYNFLTTYKPDYVNDHVEMAKRFDIFKDNIRKIHELNIYELGTATYTVNRFTDLTQEEFSSKYLGLKPSLRDANQVPMPEAKIPKVDVPEAFDWRTYGAVTPVKDQGSCGSCWAFSVTGNIEGQWKIQTGDLISLSEQELVDCDKLDHGCNGGLPDNAYRAVEELGGLETKNDYPYEGEDDKCSYNKTLSRVHISGAVNISSNETEMAQWLVHNGPISIGINANAMQFYRAGISHPWKALCNPDNLDHGVLIVGFGVKDYPLFHKRLPYWIVKNSWGASWGEEGYYRVYRGDGTCGVNKMASSAVV